MTPTSEEVVTVMAQGRQREMNETITAITSQKVSFTCSLSLRYSFDYLD
jgi:hypothetical protein